MVQLDLGLGELLSRWDRGAVLHLAELDPAPLDRNEIREAATDAGAIFNVPAQLAEGVAHLRVIAIGLGGTPHAATLLLSGVTIP